MRADVTGEHGSGGLDVALIPRLGPAVADYPPGSTFGPRDATSFEFVWILRGGASWSCHDTTVDLRPGQLLLVRPGMRDLFRWSPRRSTRHAYVHFLIPEPGNLPDPRQWPLVRGFDGPDDLLGALCRHLLRLAEEHPPAWEDRTRDALRLLVVSFVAGPVSTEEAAQPLPAPVDAVLAYLRDHWSDGVSRPVRLTDLATAAKTSPSSLCRVFRRRFGIGPVAAVELLRLARAEPLLWMSNLTIGAIAVQCGFADAYHFSRRFRAVYGVSPTAFRALSPTDAPPSPLADGGLLPLRHRL